MNSTDTLATFFGWCTIINIGFLFALLLRGLVVRKMATKVFGVSTDEVKSAYRRAEICLRAPFTKPLAATSTRTHDRREQHVSATATTVH